MPRSYLAAKHLWAAIGRQREQFPTHRPFTLFPRAAGDKATKRWLAHNFLGDGEASAIYGKPGDGKSVLQRWGIPCSEKDAGQAGLCRRRAGVPSLR